MMQPYRQIERVTLGGDATSPAWQTRNGRPRWLVALSRFGSTLAFSTLGAALAGARATVVREDGKTAWCLVMTSPKGGAA